MHSQHRSTKSFDLFDLDESLNGLELHGHYLAVQLTQSIPTYICRNALLSAALGRGFNEPNPAEDNKMKTMLLPGALLAAGIGTRIVLLPGFIRLNAPGPLPPTALHDSRRRKHITNTSEPRPAWACLRRSESPAAPVPTATSISNGWLWHRKATHQALQRQTANILMERHVSCPNAHLSAKIYSKKHGKQKTRQTYQGLGFRHSHSLFPSHSLRVEGFPAT